MQIQDNQLGYRINISRKASFFFFTLTVLVGIFFYIYLQRGSELNTRKIFISLESTQIGKKVFEVFPNFRNGVTVSSEEPNYNLFVDKNLKSSNFFEDVEALLDLENKINSNLTSLEVVITDIPQNNNLSWIEKDKSTLYSGYSSEYAGDGLLLVRVFLNNSALQNAGWSEFAISRHVLYLVACATISYLNSNLSVDEVSELAKAYLNSREGVSFEPFSVQSR